MTVDLDELSRKADGVFAEQGAGYTDDDFGIGEEEIEDEEEFEFDEDDDDEPEDAAPRSDVIKTLEEIIQVDDLDEDTIWIEKWETNILIRSITKHEFDAMRKAARRRDAKGKVNEILERELICSGVVKPRISAADYERLKEKSPGPLVKILNAIYEKSGLERESEKERERRFPAKR